MKDTITIEQWKIIIGYENYSVSNLGKVKNIQTGKILKPIDKGNGYLEVGVYKDKKLKKLKIHQLVSKHFIPNIRSLPQVNHVNGIKSDNRVENLEWVSNRENNCHKFINKNTSSIHSGVHFNKHRQKWVSQIKIKGKTKHLGTFNSEIEAYRCRVDYENDNNIINKYL